MPQLTNKTHARWMIRRDLPPVLQLEKKYSEHTMSEEDIIAFLRHPGTIGIVTEDEITGDILGYCIYYLHKNFYEILRFVYDYDDESMRGADQLFTTMAKKLKSSGRTAVKIAVPESDLSMQMLFKNYGFRAMNIVREYYENPIEDAYLMQYQILPNGETL